MPQVLLIDRQLAPERLQAPYLVAYEPLREQFFDAHVPCVWLESNEPSYVLYTSGTTGKPKGVQRDVGGYAVALAASMEHIFQGKPGDVMWTASDVGWVVGHSYIVYAPLIAGLTTVMYEGTPIRPDGGIWWRLVEQHKINLMFTAPTAMRVLKKQDPKLMEQADLSSLRALFLAGEPLDEPTAQWIPGALKKPVIDNYWQTETGWPMIAIPRGIEALPPKLGSPGVPSMGFTLTVRNEATGEICAPGEKGVIALDYPLPPGCMQTVWGDDSRFIKTYWTSVPGQQLYSTFDWGVTDEDGYVSILGRTDDVINVAGHRLGTREIEEAISSHRAVAEVAVVGVADAIKGQVALAFVVLRDAQALDVAGAREALEAELARSVDAHLGAIARPARVHFLAMLPKTRSGKLLRRAIAALAEGRDPGDLPTIEDAGGVGAGEGGVEGGGLTRRKSEKAASMPKRLFLTSYLRGNQAFFNLPADVRGRNTVSMPISGRNEQTLYTYVDARRVGQTGRAPPRRCRPCRTRGRRTGPRSCRPCRESVPAHRRGSPRTPTPARAR